MPELTDEELLAFAAKLAKFREELSDGESVVLDRTIWAAARQSRGDVVGYDDGGYDPIGFLIRAFKGTAGTPGSWPVPADWPNAPTPGLLLTDDDDPILQ